MFALIALGMALVIMTGGIDLSVGGTAAMASVVAALLSPYHWAAGLVGGLAAGLAVGARQRHRHHAGCRIQPFIATLAAMLAAYGTGLLLAGNQSVSVSYDSGFTDHRPGRFPRLPDPGLDRDRCSISSAGSRWSGTRSAAASSPSATARRRPG